VNIGQLFYPLSIIFRKLHEYQVNTSHILLKISKRLIKIWRNFTRNIFQASKALLPAFHTDTLSFGCEFIRKYNQCMLQSPQELAVATPSIFFSRTTYDIQNLPLFLIIAQIRLTNYTISSKPHSLNPHCAFHHFQIYFPHDFS